MRATDAAGNLSAYSNVATGVIPDTQAPTAPSNLTATAVSATQINLSWIASTDNVGVTGYLVERCQGASCTTFAQIGTTAGTTYNDTGADGQHQLQLSGAGKRCRQQSECIFERGQRDHFRR